MGNIMALPTAPPGSVVVVVESAEPCTCEPCCGRLWDVTQQKPPFVDLSSGEWSQFVNEMDKLTKAYKNEGRASLFFLGFILSFVLFHPAFGILRQNLGIGTSTAAMMGMIFLCIFIAIYGSLSMRKQNIEIDQKIHELCRRTSTSNCTIAYQTLWTDPCKPKGARTYRAIVYAPGAMNITHGPGITGAFVGHSNVQMGAMPIQPVMAQPMTGIPVASAQQAAPMVVMRVTCPPNVSGGQAVQIMAPSGQMVTVTIPAGVGPGQEFDAHVPSAPPVAAAVVQGQVVGGELNPVSGLRFHPVG